MTYVLLVQVKATPVEVLQVWKVAIEGRMARMAAHTNKAMGMASYLQHAPLLAVGMHNMRRKMSTLKFSFLFFCYVLYDLSLLLWMTFTVWKCPCGYQPFYLQFLHAL